MDSNNNDDKINASELINPYLVPNDESFSNYIKAIYEVFKLTVIYLAIQLNYNFLWLFYFNQFA